MVRSGNNPCRWRARSVAARAALVSLAVAAAGCQYVIGIDPLGACAFDERYVERPGTGDCYRAIDDAMSFLQAEQRCIDDGAHLVTIQDEDENAFVFELLGRDVWIGLTDRMDEGEFVWVTGEPLTFDNWTEGEPNNDDNDEHFGEMVSDGLWNDIDVTDPNRVVCER